MTVLQFFQAIREYAPALTPVVIAACFTLFQVQLTRWKPVMGKALAILELVATKLSVTEEELRAARERAELEIPTLSGRDLLDTVRRLGELEGIVRGNTPITGSPIFGPPGKGQAR